MNDWTYKIPDLHAAPKALFEFGGKGSLTAMSEEEANLCIGLYCEESSHAGRPWFIGSFHPSYEFYRMHGEVRWIFSAHYPTGDGCLLRLTAKVSQMHLDESGQKGRWAFECGACGLRSVFKAETFQTAAAALCRGGFREISMAGLDSTIKRLKVSTGSK